MSAQERRTGSLSEKDKARLRRHGWAKVNIAVLDMDPRGITAVDFRPEREPSANGDDEEE